MTDGEIVAEIKRYSAAWIVLTGGEPSLFIDSDFVDFLKKTTGKRIAVETNGTRSLPDNLDWVTLSPKTGICGEKGGEVVINHADEIKVVDIGQPLEKYFRMPCRTEDTKMYLQPCFVADKEKFEANTVLTIRRVLEDPRWALSVQLHRMLGIK